MRTPVRLAADLSGRPLLLREASVPALVRALGVESADERGFAGWLGRARRALSSHDAVEDHVTEPACWCCQVNRRRPEGSVRLNDVGQS